MEILCPKLLQAHVWVPKGSKWLINHRKRAKKCSKDWLKKEKESFKNWENIKQEWEAGNICQKWKVSNQNGRVGISGISQRVTSCMLPKTETVGDDLQLTALRLTNDDNDDYQWLPAEFRNCFSFGNVC